MRRARSATVDPDRKPPDANTTNNSLAIASHASTAATHWTARWMFWLEQLLITYGSLV